MTKFSIFLSLSLIFLAACSQSNNIYKGDNASFADLSVKVKDSKLKQSEAIEIKTKIDSVLNTEFFNNYDIRSLINSDLDRLGLVLDVQNKNVQLQGHDFKFIENKSQVIAEVLESIKVKLLEKAKLIYQNRLDTIKAPLSFSTSEKQRRQKLMYQKYYDKLLINFQGTKQVSFKEINFELYQNGLYLKENQDRTLSIAILSDDEIESFIDNYEKRLDLSYRKVQYLINYHMVNKYRI